MSISPVVTIVIPFITMAACVLLSHFPRLQRLIGIGGALALTGAGAGLLDTVYHHGIQVVQVGDWPAPYGITVVADLLSAIIVVATGVIGSCVMIYSCVDIDPPRQQWGYTALLHGLLFGICAAVLTGDLFNLYVWFEVLLMATFVLVALGGGRGQLEGALKFVALNLLASSIFLAAVGLLYAQTGTLNLADLRLHVEATPLRGVTLAIAVMLLIAFGIKAALFPAYFWLPASYHTPPVAISAALAALLTKVGVFAMLRVFTLVFPLPDTWLQTWLLVVAGLTMLIGAMGAFVEQDLRRVVSYLIISEVGFIVMGLGISSRLALSGAIYFMLHTMVATANLFLITGVLERRLGSACWSRAGSIYRLRPGWALLFFLSAFSIAGLPPLSGFWGKLVLVQAALATGHLGLAALALGTSLLILATVARIWSRYFWAEAGQQAVEQLQRPSGRHEQLFFGVPVVLLATITVMLSLAAEPVLRLTGEAAESLAAPAGYLQAVLGEH